jgi:hypothetical protein
MATKTTGNGHETHERHEKKRAGEITAFLGFPALVAGSEPEAMTGFFRMFLPFRGFRGFRGQ